MAVSKRTRYEVLRRDNHTCRYCGSKAPDVPLRIDHVTPVALGGTDNPGNLVTACQDCNAGKSSTTADAALVDDVTQADLAWGKAIEQAATIRLAEREKRMAYLGAFESRWAHSKPWNWESTLEALYAAGLPLEEMLDAAYAADVARNVRESRFIYFAGCAWRKVRELQEMARALVAEGDA